MSTLVRKVHTNDWTIWVKLESSYKGKMCRENVAVEVVGHTGYHFQSLAVATFPGKSAAHTASCPQHAVE